MIIMGIGVVGGTIFASHSPIKWIEFGIFMLILIAAIVYQKKSIKKEIQLSRDGKYSVRHFIPHLKRIKNNLNSLTGDNFDKQYVIEHFEKNINDLLVEFDDYYLSLRNDLNISVFTSVLSLYGLSERYTNRAYSAAIDGYLEEMIESVKKAVLYLEETIQEINKNIK